MRETEEINRLDLQKLSVSLLLGLFLTGIFLKSAYHPLQEWYVQHTITLEERNLLNDFVNKEAALFNQSIIITGSRYPHAYIRAIAGQPTFRPEYAPLAFQFDFNDKSVLEDMWIAYRDLVIYGSLIKTAEMAKEKGATIAYLLIRYRLMGFLGIEGEFIEKPKRYGSIVVENEAGYVLRIDQYLGRVINLLEGGENDPLVIADDSQSFFWKAIGHGSGSLGISISDDSGERIKGLDALRIQVTEDGDYKWVSILHNYDFPQDWSGRDFLCLYIKGNNTGGRHQVMLLSSGNEWSMWDIPDDFTGWKRFILPLSAPEKTYGDFDITHVIRIVINPARYYAGTFYVDRVLLDII